MQEQDLIEELVGVHNKGVKYPKKIYRVVHYSKLSEPKPQQVEQVNLFAVIIDFHISQKKQQWMLYMKVVDPSLNYKVTCSIEENVSGNQHYQNGGNQYQNQNMVKNLNHAVLTFFASERKHLPQINRIGEIIRVQKCVCRSYRGQKQFNINVFEGKSNWAIFGCEEVLINQTQLPNLDYEGQQKQFMGEQLIQPDDDLNLNMTGMDQEMSIEFMTQQQLLPNKSKPYQQQPYEPYSFSKVGDQNEYTIHENEKKLLKELRIWAYDHFKQMNYFEPFISVPVKYHLDTKGQRFYKSFDIQARIVYSRLFTNHQQHVDIGGGQSILPSQQEQSFKPAHFFQIILQDVNGQRFQGEIPITKFCYSHDKEFSHLALTGDGSISNAKYAQSIGMVVLKLGNVLRIRNAKLCQEKNYFDEQIEKLTPVPSLIEEYKDDLVFHLDFSSEWGQKFSLMKVPEYFQLAQTISERVVPNCVFQQLLRNEECMLQNKVVISKISKLYDEYEYSTLQQVYRNDQSSQQEPDKSILSKIRFSLMAVIPLDDPREICRLFCHPCQKSLSFKTYNTNSQNPPPNTNNQSQTNQDQQLNKNHVIYKYNCPICDSTCQAEYQMVMLIRDQQQECDSTVYKLQYASQQNAYVSNIQQIQSQSQSEDNNDIQYQLSRDNYIVKQNPYDSSDTSNLFAGIQPCNLYDDNNKHQLLQIQTYLEFMTKYNVCIDAAVQKQMLGGGMYTIMLKDCIIQGGLTGLVQGFVNDKISGNTTEINEVKDCNKDSCNDITMKD